MNGIQGFGNIQSVSQLLGPSAGGSLSLPTSGAGGGPAEALRSIQNEDGQSLLDIKDELKSAVSDALQNMESGDDPRSTVEGALKSTLEENGFDPAEVKGAMEENMGGMRAMMAMAGRGGGGFQGGGFPGGAGGFSQGGMDMSQLLQSGGNEEQLIDSFLSQLRAGSNLDLSA